MVEHDPDKMSIASLISRFTKPCLFNSGLPSYRNTYAPSQSADASFVEWSKILPLPSSMLSSFRELFQGEPPRLTFFGEQHHQPYVMRAQLQALHALHEQCQLASTSPQKPYYQLHLVLEHFSVLDQEMLAAFSQGSLSPQGLADRYTSESEEGFRIARYIPLLMLARELKVPIWGGFPPRSWARQLFRDGIDNVKVSEDRRVATGKEQECQSPAPFTAWSSVTHVSSAHRNYLSSLMRPEIPPYVTTQGGDAPADQSLYPAWLVKPSAVQTKGFLPAQALKDSYLAHVTAWILQGARRSTCRSGHTTSSQPERQVINIVLVACGLGHCEYGFGAPERVVDLLEQAGDSSVKPYIIASKPVDAGVWLGADHPIAVPDDIGSISSSEEAVKRWRDIPSERKLADAVLLYEWMDEEELQANDNGGKKEEVKD